MVAKNDITGDAIQSRTNSKEFQENHERIFGTKDAERAAKKKADQEYFAKLAAETKARLEGFDKAIMKDEYYDLEGTDEQKTS